MPSGTAHPGWTIPEAMERTSSPSLWEECARLLAMCEASPSDDLDDLHGELDDAEEFLEEEFSRMMAAGGAVAVGRAETGAELVIPVEAWRPGRMTIDRARSFVAYRVSGKGFSKINEVRVFPRVHLGNAFDGFDGTDLFAAFRDLVLSDGEVKVAISSASGCILDSRECLCDSVLSGSLTIDQRFWPLDSVGWNLAPKWLAEWRPNRGRIATDWLNSREFMDRRAAADPEYRAALDLIRRAESILRDRFEAFLDPLRRGIVEARGFLVGRSDVGIIHERMWSSPTTLVDFPGSSLYVASVSAPPRQEWTGLTLHSRAAQVAPSTDVKPAPADNESTTYPQAIDVPAPTPKDRGGANPTHDPQLAVECLAIRVIFEGPPTERQLNQLVIKGFETFGRAVPSDGYMKKKIRIKRNLLWCGLNKYWSETDQWNREFLTCLEKSKREEKKVRPMKSDLFCAFDLLTLEFLKKKPQSTDELIQMMRECLKTLGFSSLEDLEIKDWFLDSAGCLWHAVETQTNPFK